MIIVGIDPGKTGGIVSLSGENVVTLTVMPDLAIFADLLEGWLKSDAIHVFVEKSQSFPKQGIVSAFNYGAHFGSLLGVLVALRIRHTLVPPATWTRVMHVGTRVSKAKARSVEAVGRLFPGVSLVPEGTRQTKPHLGLVDALLIAEYGRRILSNG